MIENSQSTEPTAEVYSEYKRVAGTLSLLLRAESKSLNLEIVEGAWALMKTLQSHEDLFRSMLQDAIFVTQFTDSISSILEFVNQSIEDQEDEAKISKLQGLLQDIQSTNEGILGMMCDRLPGLENVP